MGDARLQEVESWFLVNQRDRVIEFAALNQKDQMMFSLEIYTAQVLVEKCLSMLNEESRRYYNPERLLVHWSGHRTANSYNCAVVEREDENGRHFEVVSAEEMSQIASQNNLDEVWFVSLLPDGRNDAEVLNHTH